MAHIRREGKNYYINSNVYTHQYGPDGKVLKSTVLEGGKVRDITGIPHYKKVENQFNIVGANFGNVAIASSGKTNFSEHNETFEKGATKQNYNISGGNFVGTNIGGTASHINRNSNISAGERGGPGASPILWEKINVELTLVSILRSGIGTEDLLVALKRGHKLQDIGTAVERTSSDAIPALASSLKSCSPNDLAG
uniref:Uncharacterized protein LOC100179113 n=1 Tax=Phallusia mammillata TaxID=59560 RepID=A0A6F9DGA1_9ASCI|nr:uncharacterized protein LOC100179113 [Phallusia mammillata]